MDDQPTEMLDLTTFSLGDLRRPELQTELAPYRQRLIEQVARPRTVNIGTGPPGRAD